MQVGQKIGELVKRRRHELEWSQLKLARESFISLGHLQNIEAGIRGASEQTKQSIFKALGLTSENENKSQFTTCNEAIQ